MESSILDVNVFNWLEAAVLARSAIDSELASLAARTRADEDVRILEALLGDTEKALKDDDAFPGGGTGAKLGTNKDGG